MSIKRNNYVFKGHKALLGGKFVTYGEVELPVKYDIFSQSQNFDWGHTGPAAKQLGFSILCQLIDENFAKDFMLKFTNDIIRELPRDWVLSTANVLKWVEKTVPKDEMDSQGTNTKAIHSQKRTKQKSNVVKDICNELQITQKQLAQILEVPEGTVSSWAVKNEIPRLGKKAIEFYTLSHKNQKIVDSYKDFIHLLQAS